MATKKKSARKRSSGGASEEIRDEMHAAHEGKLKSEKQAIAIGLSKARRAGKDVPPPKKGTSSPAVRKKALKDIAAGKKAAAKKTSARKKTAGNKTTARKKSTAKKTTRKSASKRGR